MSELEKKEERRSVRPQTGVGIAPEAEMSVLEFVEVDPEVMKAEELVIGMTVTGDAKGQIGYSRFC